SAFMGNLSSKSAGNVVFGLTYPWGGKEDSCLAKFYQLSHIEKSRIIRRARRLLHVVGDNHYGDRVLQLMDQFLDLRRRYGIESGARFVHEQHFRVHRQCPRYAQSLLLSSRETGSRFLQIVLYLLP